MENFCENDYGLVISGNDILKMLPHRYPFIMIDRVYVKEAGIKGIGKKNVTMNEQYFSGHFPGHPVVPGVLIIESIAQTIAIVYGSKHMDGLDSGKVLQHVGYLGAANIKFLRMVTPGDTMMIHVELENKIRNISNFNTKVYVDKNVVAKGSVTVTEN